MLDVAVRLPRADLVHAEVELLHVLVVDQLFRFAVEHHLAVFHDVAVAGDGKRHAGVLLHQQDRRLLFLVDVLETYVKAASTGVSR